MCSPVIPDAVKEAVAMVHHGSHSPQNCSVAHQTGRQHEVTPTATADTNTTVTDRNLMHCLCSAAATLEKQISGYCTVTF